MIREGGYRFVWQRLCRCQESSLTCCVLVLCVTLSGLKCDWDGVSSFLWAGTSTSLLRAGSSYSFTFGVLLIHFAIV